MLMSGEVKVGGSSVKILGSLLLWNRIVTVNPAICLSRAMILIS